MCFSMIAQEEIRKLSLQDKFELLETVWAEISSDPEQIEVPQWHLDILNEREAALKEGRTTVLDWEDAKRQIRAATRST